MSDLHPAAVPKVHPATREILPEDPMELHAVEIPGDPELMLRLLVEEYARIGWGVEGIMHLARDPGYPAFHALYRLLGETSLRTRLQQILSRCGVTHVTITEAPNVSENLVQLEGLDSASR